MKILASVITLIFFTLILSVIIFTCHQYIVEGYVGSGGTYIRLSRLGTSLLYGVLIGGVAGIFLSMFSLAFYFVEGALIKNAKISWVALFIFAGLIGVLLFIIGLNETARWSDHTDLAYKVKFAEAVSYLFIGTFLIAVPLTAARIFFGRLIDAKMK